MIHLCLECEDVLMLKYAVAHYLSLSSVGIYQLGVQLCLIFTFIPKTLQIFIAQKNSRKGLQEAWGHSLHCCLKNHLFGAALVHMGAVFCLGVNYLCSFGLSVNFFFWVKDKLF